MIRKTLDRTKQATYSILVPSPQSAAQGMPTPSGTGFFISPDGYFLTALHVVDKFSIADIWLQQSHQAGTVPALLQWPSLIKKWPEFDLALLKLDFEQNKEKAHLGGRTTFPFIEVDLTPQEEGAPVYAFGYPLPLVNTPKSALGFGLVGHVGLGHRTTSAIISSTLEHTKMIQTSNDAQVYVLDKALNHGNSGGPIVMTESGKAIAVCSRFQPDFIEQPDGKFVVIPSLYGVVSSISNITRDLGAVIPYTRPGGVSPNA